MNERDYREGRVRVSRSIEESLIELIKQEDDIAKKKKHPATWYRDEVAKRLKLSERDNPSLRSYEDKISYFRKRLREKNPLDESWSIAASLKNRISPEATKDLFDIWRVSLAIDRPITIRQARWIVHLRHLFPAYLGANWIGLREGYPGRVTQSLWLISSSWLYSIRERVSEIMEEKYFDTTDLDAAFFMPHWEHATALKLGKIPLLEFSREQITKLKESEIELEGPPREAVSVEMAVWLDVYRKARFFPITPSTTEESDSVSAHWLSYLIKGPKWDSLSHTEYHKIADRLHKWVEQHNRPSMIKPATAIDPELLKMVGYDVQTEDDKQRENKGGKQ